MKEYKYEEFVCYQVLVLFVCGSKISQILYKKISKKQQQKEEEKKRKKRKKKNEKQEIK